MAVHSNFSRGENEKGGDGALNCARRRAWVGRWCGDFWKVGIGGCWVRSGKEVISVGV